MAFDGINGILGTGGRKTACRGKEGRNQELVRPDENKQKTGAAFLQKIFHYSAFSCIRPSRSTSCSSKTNGKKRENFLLKQRAAFVKQTTHGICNIRRIFQTETFPYRYNHIHER
jgi:hypothetical protein